MWNRREFLSAASAAAAFGCSGGAAPESASASAQANNIHFAYSGFVWQQDIEEGIKTAAKWGFEGVEPFRNHIMRYLDDPAALKAQFDEAGMVMPTCSNGGEGMSTNFIDPQHAAETIEDHFAFARDFLTHFDCNHFKINVGRRPETAPPDEQLKTMSETLTELGKRTADWGIRLAAHPHIWGPLERESEVEKVLEMTDPRYVSIVADTAHLTLGGMDPVRIVRDHYDRVAALHFKDTEPKYKGYTGPTPTQEEHQQVNLYKVMGTGGVDFPTVYNVLTDHGYNGWVTMDYDPPRAWEGTIDDQISTNKKYLEDVLGVQLG